VTSAITLSSTHMQRARRAIRVLLFVGHTANDGQQLTEFRFSPTGWQVAAFLRLSGLDVFEAS